MSAAPAVSAVPEPPASVEPVRSWRQARTPAGRRSIGGPRRAQALTDGRASRGGRSELAGDGADLTFSAAEEGACPAVPSLFSRHVALVCFRPDAVGNGPFFSGSFLAPE